MQKPAIPKGTRDFMPIEMERRKLMSGGGIMTTFAVFAVSFALAAGAAFLLPEKRDAGID